MKKVFLISLIFGVLFLAGCQKKEIIKEEKQINSYDDFAKCLTEKGATMYGTEWCGYCKKQKGMFKESFVHVNYVDCDQEKIKCQQAGVRGYPTWGFSDGPNKSGVQEFSTLAQKTGCNFSN